MDTSVVVDEIIEACSGAPESKPEYASTKSFG